MPVSALVVEKDPATRDTIVEMLAQMHYSAVGLEHAGRAYDVLEAIQFDLAIISLTLHDVDGIEIAITAKANQAKVKVIVVSGHPPPEVLNPVIDAFVRKPFTLEEIDAAIKDVLAVQA